MFQREESSGKGMKRGNVNRRLSVEIVQGRDEREEKRVKNMV